MRAAGVTRGALYHQFADKRSCSRAVFEHVEGDVTERIADVASAAARPTRSRALGRAPSVAGACAEPEVQRIVLLDAPVVLAGSAGARSACATALGLVEARCTPRSRRASSSGSRRGRSRTC